MTFDLQKLYKTFIFHRVAFFAKLQPTGNSRIALDLDLGTYIYIHIHFYIFTRFVDLVPSYFEVKRKYETYGFPVQIEIKN